jgi:hypothetical protein
MRLFNIPKPEGGKDWVGKLGRCMMHSFLRILVVLFAYIPTHLSYGASEQVTNGKPFKELQNQLKTLTAENAELKDRVSDLSDPSAKYPYVEQVSLGNGMTKTVLFKINEWSYKGTDNGTLDSGTGPLINALGKFTATYDFYYGGIRTYYKYAEPRVPPLYDCPFGGEADPIPMNRENSAYLVQYSLHNLTGGMMFDNISRDAGLYRCQDNATGHPQLFKVLSGRGVGKFSCIESAFLYGYTWGGYDPSFSPPVSFDDTIWYGAYPGGYTGRFRPETNGLTGTSYIEIIAPDGCIPEK